MVEPSFTLERGKWAGWQEQPVPDPGWGPSPILITDVQPLKTGKGVLRISFIHPIRPVTAKRRTIDLRILLRAATHMVGTFKDEDGTRRTAVVSSADYDWITSFCPVLWRRRPPKVWGILIDGKPLPGPTPEEYLAGTFGEGADDVLAAATVRSFGREHPPMPKRAGFFSLDQTYSPFDSWMIARGFVPTVMEEKWFIYLEAGRLLFRRSWTGILIYDVEAAWRGDILYLGQVRVNRDPEQYGETDDNYDRSLLSYLILAILLSEPAQFPNKADLSAEQSAIQAWSVAGKASLQG